MWPFVSSFFHLAMFFKKYIFPFTFKERKTIKVNHEKKKTPWKLNDI